MKKSKRGIIVSNTKGNEKRCVSSKTRKGEQKAGEGGGDAHAVAVLKANIYERGEWKKSAKGGK